MEKLTISIRTGNAASEGENLNYELARILKELAERIENGRIPDSLLDINGNIVGNITVE